MLYQVLILDLRYVCEIWTGLPLVLRYSQKRTTVNEDGTRLYLVRGSAPEVTCTPPPIRPIMHCTLGCSISRLPSTSLYKGFASVFSVTVELCSCPFLINRKKRGNNLYYSCKLRSTPTPQQQQQHRALISQLNYSHYHKICIADVISLSYCRFACNFCLLYCPICSAGIKRLRVLSPRANYTD
jgi:hypothetical protein